MNDPVESLRLLNIISTGYSSNSIKSQGKDYQYWSNTAVVYLLQGKNHLACLYSERAVKEMRKKSTIDRVGNKDRDREKESVGESSSTDKEYVTESVSYCGWLPHRCTVEVLYDAAIALLLTGDYLGAILYFQHTTKELGSTSILWIRMAECCIQHHAQQEIVKQTNGSGTLLSICEGSTSRGRRLQLRSNSNQGPGSSSSQSSSSAAGDIRGSNGTPHTASLNSKISESARGTNSKALSLNKAVQYLSNALFLIRKVRRKDDNVSIGSAYNRNGDDDESESDCHHCNLNVDGILNGMEIENPPQSTVAQVQETLSLTATSTSTSTNDRQRLDVLECTALSHLAYVHLELDSPRSALSAAKKVLAFSSASISEQTR